jgi:N utilization substance protein B
MGSRRKGREAALRILYFIDVSAVSVAQALKSYWGHLAEPSEPIEQEFANDIVRAYAERQEEIDGLIRSSSHHWRLERMPIVDRNVLRVAIAELQTMSDIPKRVTLNEAVELAKRFGSEGSGSFVNGVLDRIATELGKP